MTQTMLALDGSAAPDQFPLFDVATSLASLLRTGRSVSRQALSRMMSAAFGGSDAWGVWSMRQAYDALEVAQVLLLRSPDAELLCASFRSSEHCRRVPETGRMLVRHPVKRVLWI